MWKNGNIVEKTKGNRVMGIYRPYRGSLARRSLYTHYSRNRKQFF